MSQAVPKWKGGTKMKQKGHFTFPFPSSTSHPLHLPCSSSGSDREDREAAPAHTENQWLIGQSTCRSAVEKKVTSSAARSLLPLLQHHAPLPAGVQYRLVMPLPSTPFSLPPSLLHIFSRDTGNIEMGWRKET